MRKKIEKMVEIEDKLIVLALSIMALVTLGYIMDLIYFLIK
jgi:hypothetical protein